MATNWQAFFDSWASPPSDTEIDERDRTEREIREALEGWPPVAQRNFRVFVKGSYRSGTNVRRGSDLDLAVELVGAETGDCSFTFETGASARGLLRDQLGLVEAAPSYGEAVRSFKDDCVDALVDAFGPMRVERHNKCIQISEKSTTLPADVVPCTSHRLYEAREIHHRGIEITPDTGSRIVNWPRQDYENGVAKNASTSRRYKRVVRGLKALENRLAEEGRSETSSWLIECLVYNVPDERFDSPSNYCNALGILLWLYEELSSASSVYPWCEVNGLKSLFGVDQPWNREDALSFVATSLRRLTS